MNARWLIVLGITMTSCLSAHAWQMRASRTHAGTRMARVATGMVPLGMASVGTYEALQGNTSLGLGLLAGAGAMSMARTYALRTLVERKLQKHHDRLVAFIQAWPAQKESVPLSMHAFMDDMHERMVLATKLKQHTIFTPAQIQTITNAMQIMAVVDAAPEAPLTKEYEQWQFVLEQLGLVNHPSTSYIKMLFKKVPYGAWRMLLWGAWGNLLSRFFLWRSQKAWDYVRGRRHDYLPYESSVYEKRRIAQEEKEIQGEWLARHLGWYGDDGDPQEKRTMAVYGVGMGIGVGIGFIHWLIGSGAFSLAARRAKKALFDRFVAAWPLVKKHVPPALHERFDTLYTDAFDHETQELTLSSKQRRAFIKKLQTDAQPFRRAIAQFGDTRRHNIFKRLFRRS